MKKFLIILLISFTLPFNAKANIIDLPEIVLEIINLVNDKATFIQKQYQSIQKIKTEIKSGIFGSSTFKLFKDAQRLVNTVEDSVQAIKNSYRISVFHAFMEVLNTAEVLSTAELEFEVKENFLQQLGEGNDTQNLKTLRDNTQANAKNNISTLYAKALATRYKIELESKKEKEDGPQEFTFDNKMDVLYAIRLKSATTLQRKANVVQIEGSLLEYYGMKELGAMGVLLPQENDATPDKIIASQNYEQEEAEDE